MKTYRGGPDSHSKHYFGCYVSAKDRECMAASFIREGLLSGEHALCLVPDPQGMAVRFRDACLVDGFSPPPTPHVTFHRSETIYIRDGAFDPDRVLSLLVSYVQSALELGFTGMRVVSDASWLLEHPLGAHQVVEYEHRVNRVAQGMPCSLLCLYPGKALPRAFLTYVFLAHPYVFKRDGCFFNPHYDDFDILMERPFQKTTYETLLEELEPL